VGYGHASEGTQHELEIAPLEGLRAVSIALNRPSTLNALSNALLHDLIRCFEEIQWDRALRVVVLWGNGGRAFCSGSDIREFKDAGPSEMRYHCHLQHRVQRLIQTVPQIVIAGVHGYVLGGGLELALACDLRLSDESAVFGFPEVNLGGLPGGGGIWDLLRLVGVARSKELLLCGDRISATRALELGLINRVVPKDEVRAATIKMAETLCQKDAVSLASIKALVNRWAKAAEVEDILDYAAVSRCRTEGGLHEGMAGFGVKSHKLPQ
jgi:enoyl-CoA hydratase